jgi:hypothetical protein
VALHQGLRHIQRFKAHDITEFLGKDRICHIYGKVRDVPPLDPPLLKWSKQSNWYKRVTAPGYDDTTPLLDYVEYKIFLDGIYDASRHLRVIDPKDKETDVDVIKAASEVIEQAKFVYILGYGFDENNSERLGLPKCLYYERAPNKFVLFTNFGDISRVNKRASNLLFHNMRHFPSGGSLVEQSDGVYHYERSVRNVYDALALDFESLEET